MRPSVNMSDENRTTDIGNSHKKIDKDRACDFGDTCIVTGEENPSRRYAMQPIVKLSEEDRATDTGSKRKKLVKIGCVVPKIFSRIDRQTHRQTG